MKNTLLLIILIGVIRSLPLFSLTHTVLNNSDNGDNTLRSFVESVNYGDTIVLGNVHIQLNTPININKNLTIMGADSNGYGAIIDVNYNDRLFSIQAGNQVHLKNLHIINGDVRSQNAYGGAILNFGQLFLENCKIEDCKAINGGAIANYGEYIVHNCEFVANESNNYGGAIYHMGFSNTQEPTIKNCLFSYNLSKDDGGALYNDGYGGTSNPVIINTIFQYNRAHEKGGVIYNNAHLGIANPVILNCTFWENEADSSGNIIFSYGNLGNSTTQIQNSIVWDESENTSSENFATESANININHSLIPENACPTNCNCSGDLGMVYNQDPMFVISDGEGNNGYAPSLLKLSGVSPAINSGSNIYILNNNIETDFNNNNRIINSTVDLGAFEYDCELAALQTYHLDIKILLEGAFNETIGSMYPYLNVNNLLPKQQPYSLEKYHIDSKDSLTVFPLEMVDWVLLEIKFASNSPSICKKVALLMSDGTIRDLDGINFPSIPMPDYSEIYVIVRHRNHLDVMSHAITVENDVFSYDFTIGVSQAFGNFQQKLNNNGQAMLFAGDVNNDMTIQISDFDLWQQNAAVLHTYNNVDFNMDGHVQTTDYDTWFPNRSKLAPSELDLN